MSSASIDRVGSQGINPSGYEIPDFRFEDVLVRNPNFESPVSTAPAIIQKTALPAKKSWWGWFRFFRS